jgi:hypothetical protein
MVPQHVKDTLTRYVEHRILPGGFLTAVLSNDLFGAVDRADSESLANLTDIVRYVWVALPMEAWGSKDKMYEFVKNKFYERVG